MLTRNCCENCFEDNEDHILIWIYDRFLWFEWCVKIKKLPHNANTNETLLFEL